jgi:hypothetical protein
VAARDVFPKPGGALSNVSGVRLSARVAISLGLSMIADEGRGAASLAWYRAAARAPVSTRDGITIDLPFN